MQRHSFRRVDWFSEASALLQVFTGAISQEDVYKESVAPLVDSLIEGTSTTVITYGPSGSGKLSIQTCKSLRLRLATCLLLRTAGKSYTVFGDPGSKLEKRRYGILTFVCSRVLQHIQAKDACFCRISAIGIHDERIFDLLEDPDGVSPPKPIGMSEDPHDDFLETAPGLTNIKHEAIEGEGDIDSLCAKIDNNRYKLLRTHFGIGTRTFDGTMHIRTESLLVMLNTVQSHHSDLTSLRYSVLESIRKMKSFVTEEEADSAYTSLHQIEEALSRLEYATKQLRNKLTAAANDSDIYAKTCHLPSKMSVVYDIDLAQYNGEKSTKSRMRIVETVAPGCTHSKYRTNGHTSISAGATPRALERCMKALRYSFPINNCRSSPTQVKSKAKSGQKRNSTAYREELRGIPHSSPLPKTGQVHVHDHSPAHLPAAIRRKLTLSTSGKVSSPEHHAPSPSTGKTYNIPFRDSKLTRLLQGPLSGACEVAFIATLRPELPWLEGNLHAVDIAGLAKEARSVLSLGTSTALSGVAKPLIPSLWGHCKRVQIRLGQGFVPDSHPPSVTESANSANLRNDDWFTRPKRASHDRPPTTVPGTHDAEATANTFETALPSVGDILSGTNQPVHKPASPTIPPPNKSPSNKFGEESTSSMHSSNSDYSENGSGSTQGIDRRGEDFYGMLNSCLGKVERLLHIIETDFGSKFVVDPSLRRTNWSVE
eukprot:gb/GECG01003011.1/.p1 GENE.gb/GECG01003011.1/~~gb/GECG01003011.1/.p1  ORF type:complete len:710 (+),score=62.71 gb/GECG01003011.1/:1-2130(+)